MPPLKNLEQEFPIIDSNFQRFCASHGIISVEDFLVQDLYVLVSFAEREPTAKLLKQGITKVLSIIDGQHQPWLNGVELLNDAQQNKHFLSTGCEGIDLLLRGGLREGQLTELVGPSSSGKTQVCLYAASSVADRHLGSVLFLDTGNSFSPKRVVAIVNQLSNPSVKEAKERRLERIMSSILCHSVFDIFALLDVVNQLDITLKHQEKNEDTKLRLLVVDSISSLITPVLGGKDSHGRSLMVSVGFRLKKLAHEHNVSVLVTNHTVGGVAGTSKPALGESWKCVPHVRLLLFREPGSNICNLSVLKSTSMASGCTAKFVIHDDE